ncbi:hypothetical protein OEZ85_009649 [Tetradesmus obliquus]|uniref:Uncharacterized protein n=1 Tax=Tetradesmus obliquus TaxID=3088 RepID=A0ABY8U9X3_TETOB|nr:hypothetical protein OEZ85_009649 [Tetradesmus obliquus]
MTRHLVLVTVLLLAACSFSFAKPAVGDSCSVAEVHCGAPDSKMGCCHSNTKCYMQTDCASYIADCGFTNDGKKGESLGSCLPDSTAFTPAKCAADTKNQEGIPVLNPTVKCWQSERLLCNVYRNKTATYFTAQCKPSNKTSSSAAHTQAARLPLLVGAFAAALLALLLA